jgi:L-seryl-tRNA(Ser) seleniumtransferase
MPTPETNRNFRDLPSVDELLRSEAGIAIAEAVGSSFAGELAREAVARLRGEIAAGSSLSGGKAELSSRAVALMSERLKADRASGTRRVINATGVVLHTNLGRAPLSAAATQAIANAAQNCTLEYDILTGKRGKRGRQAEELLASLTGAEDALIVNNCASAAFFVLTAFAAGGEVVISRGELVEIGGDFRVPDVLTQSGATLREVGTTNRTKLADYEKAISPNTKLILRVHPSNYRIVGFTAVPTLAELAGLANRTRLIFYEDIGSGALIDLGRFGVTGEPTVGDSIAAGVDVVTFSGDKLLGGPQAGIIAGKADHIGKLRKHPLYRALRVDKLAYAALEATLDAYRREAYDEIPVLRMLAATAEGLAHRAEAFVAMCQKTAAGPQISDLRFEIIDGFSAIGGGAAPHVSLPTKLIAVSHESLSASRLEYQLRMSETPVIARIVDDHVVIDLRTVAEGDEAKIVTSLLAISS